MCGANKSRRCPLKSWRTVDAARVYCLNSVLCELTAVLELTTDRSVAPLENHGRQALVDATTEATGMIRLCSLVTS